MRGLLLLLSPLLAFGQPLDESQVLPEGACRSTSRPALWGDPPHRCFSINPRGPLRDGERHLHIFSGTPGASGVGYAFEFCRAGERRVEMSFCRRWCQVETTFFYGNRCSFHWSRGRVQEGEAIPIGKGRCSAVLTCSGGDWLVLR